MRFPDPSDNFLQGLSDFWTQLFTDTELSSAFFEAGQMQIGQLYLDMCQTVLGTNLDNVPLFSRRYFQHVLLREDGLRFIEGQSLDQDAFHILTPKTYADVALFANRVVEPTAVLARGQIAVRDGKIFVNRDIGINDLTSSGFATRSITVVTPATLHLLGPEAPLSALPGDVLLLKRNGVLTEAVITMIRGRDVSLDSAASFPLDSRHTASVSFLRTPFDMHQKGRPLVSPSDQHSFSLTTTASTAVITSPSIDVPASQPYWVQDAADWVGGYVWVQDEETPQNSGFYRVNSADNVAHTAVLARTANFSSSATLTGRFVRYPVNQGLDESLPRPTAVLDHTFVVPGSLSATSRRTHATVVDGTVYPAGGSVLEGVDFIVHAEQGLVEFLTAWDETVENRVSYDWRKLLESYDYLDRGEWDGSTAYSERDVVYRQVNDVAGYWCCVVASAATGSFRMDQWVPYQLFSFDDAVQVRAVSLWAIDAKVDERTLYRNFGYLLGSERPTSEQYRQYLRGVSQLFLLSPSLDRFTSALNVIAGYPVIRDNGEVVESYGSGFESLGTESVMGDDTLGFGGRLLDYAEGHGGVTVEADGTFTSPLAHFRSEDVGVVLRVWRDFDATDVVIVRVVDDSTAIITPALANADDLRFRYRHSVAAQTFNIDDQGGGFQFNSSHLGASIVIERVRGIPWRASVSYLAGTVVTVDSVAYEAIVDSSDAEFDPSKWRRQEALADRDIGTFTIQSILGPSTVKLDTPYGFTDADALRWRLSIEGQQTVRTSRASYRLPLDVVVREEAKTTGHVFRAYDWLIDNFRVVDYVSDPTWWHRATIPAAMIPDGSLTPLRRQIIPDLIPNTFDPFDDAVFGDPGLLAGADDEGFRVSRAGTFTWMGMDWVRWTGAADTVRTVDVGQYLTIDDDVFFGSYRIAEVDTDQQAMRLERFPPRVASRLIPPIAFSASLPSLVYRRTVAFILMDRYLKYHAIRVSIVPAASMPLSFLNDMIPLLTAAKPSDKFLLVEPATRFDDILVLTESFIFDIGHPLADSFSMSDNRHAFGDGLLFGEFHSYVPQLQTGTMGSSGPLVISATPSPPYSGARMVCLRGHFSLGSHGGQPLARGRDYTVDFDTGTVTVPAIDAGPYEYRSLWCALKVHDPAPSPWWSGIDTGETPMVAGGPSPLHRGPLEIGSAGLVERAVQITIGTP